jgi:hypothetical protein
LHFFWDTWAARASAHDDSAFGVDDGLDKVAGSVCGILDLLLALVIHSVVGRLPSVIFRGLGWHDQKNHLLLDVPVFIEDCVGKDI